MASTTETVGPIILLLVLSTQTVPSSAGQGGCFKQKDVDYFSRDERDTDFGNPPGNWAGVATDQERTMHVGVALLKIPDYMDVASDIIIAPIGQLRVGMCVHFGIGYRGKQTLGTSADSATIEAVQNVDCRIDRRTVQKFSVARLTHKIEFSLNGGPDDPNRNVQAAYFPLSYPGTQDLQVNKAGFTGSTVGRVRRETSERIPFSTFHNEGVRVVEKSNCAPVQGQSFLETHSICVAKTGASTSTGQTSNSIWRMEGSPLVANFIVGAYEGPAVYAMQYGTSYGSQNTGDWYFPLSACRNRGLDITNEIEQFSKLARGIDQPRS